MTILDLDFQINDYADLIYIDHNGQENRTRVRITGFFSDGETSYYVIMGRKEHLKQAECLNDQKLLDHLGVDKVNWDVGIVEADELEEASGPGFIEVIN